MKKFVLFLVFVFVASLALAQNDPGHDTLYIEEQGDSELNGTFNVTENQTIKGGELALDQFLFRSDANLPGSNINYVVGSHDNWISINSLGNGKVIKLQDQVANGLVQIGTTGSNLVDLNISSDLYILGDLITLDNNFEIRTDGTFPSSISSIVANETGASAKLWLTSQQVILAEGTTTGIVHVGRGGSDSVLLNVTGNSVIQGTLTVEGASGTINGGNICTTTNGLCAGAGASSSAGGWTNTTTMTRTLLNVNISNSTQTNFFFNSTSGKLGIGTTTPAEKLVVSNTGAPAKVIVERTDSGGTTYQIYTGTQGTSIGTTTEDFLQLMTNDTIRMFINDTGLIGIGTTTPGERLHVNGSINVTSGNDICIEGGNCLSSVGGGGGSKDGWDNSTTHIYLSDPNDNLNISDALFVNGTSNKIGIGTTTPTDELTVIGNIENIANTNADPVEVSSSAILGSTPSDVAVVGKYVYVSHTTGNFTIVDVTNPTSPVTVSTFDDGSTQEFFVAGDYVYTAAWNNLEIFDISDPGNPVKVSTLSVPSPVDNIRGIHVQGGYAFVSGTDTAGSFGSTHLLVFDVSDPQNPSHITSLQVQSEGQAYDGFDVLGKFAFLTGYLVDGSFNPHAYLYMVDISDPENPTLADSLNVTGSLGSLSFTDLKVSGKYAYFMVDGSTNNVYVINISNSSKITTTGSTSIDGTPTGIQVSGRYVYIVGDAGNDFDVIDVSDPTSPSLAASVTLSNDGYYGAPGISGRYAYVVASGDFRVLDLRGIETTSAEIHSLEAGNLQVRNNIITQGQLQATNGVIAGSGGIYSRGGVAISKNLFVNSSIGIGSGMVTPGEKLRVNGSINVTAGEDICIEGGNCLSSVSGGSGGGNVSGTGTQYTIPMWENDQNLTDSMLSQDAGGNLLTVSGNVSVPSSFYIGSGTITSTGLRSIAIGNNADSTNQDTIALGYESDATNTNSISIGGSSTSSGSGSIALGQTTTGTQTASIAIGTSASSTGSGGIAIGQTSSAENSATVAIAQLTNASGVYGIAIGYSADALGSNSIAIGENANATAADTISIGQNSDATATNAIAIGENALADQTESIALGFNANTDTTNQLMIGASTDNLNTYIHGTLETTGNILLNGDWLSGDGGNEGIFIDSNGQVGIGTNNPGSELSIVGSGVIVALNDTGSGTITLLAADPTQGYVGTNTADRFSIITNQQNRLTVSATGEVGIGTTTPDEKLHIVGDQVIEDTSPGLILNETDGIPFTIAKNADITYFINGTAIANSMMTFNHSTGHIGIGTTSPLVQLHVHDNNNGYNLINVNNTNTGDDAYSGIMLVTDGGVSYFLRNSDAYDDLPGVAGDTVIADQGGDDIVIFGAAEIIRFKNNGDVGLGTTTPTAKLSVESGNITMNSTYSMCFNEACTSRIYDNGTALIIEGE